MAQEFVCNAVRTWGRSAKVLQRCSDFFCAEFRVKLWVERAFIIRVCRYRSRRKILVDEVIHDGFF